LSLQSALNDARLSDIGIVALKFAAWYLSVGTTQGSTCMTNAYLEILPLP
jgi:hypothetical protein